MSLVKRTLAGVLLTCSFLGCNSPTEPVEQKVSGRVVWDIENDGSYEGVSRAMLILFAGDSIRARTTSSKDGNFSFYGFFDGDHILYSYKAHPLSLSIYHQIENFYISKKAANPDLGEIKLIKAFSLWPS